MKLSKDQQDMLNGNKGRGAQKAMEILTAYGDCFDAEKMVPITSVHFAGNFSVMMDEGIEWLEELALEGARVSVFTTKNSELYDFEQAQELKIPLIYQERQKRIDAAIKALGIVPTYTCHHYLVGNVPRFGDHIAWASSGSQVYANSIIGARSNRDGDHVALAAAIVGAIPEWGLHLVENRRGEFLIDVSELDHVTYDPADYKALGSAMGKIVGGRIPVFIGLPPHSHIEALKGILYSITVTGSMGLVHLIGITPEAPTLDAAFGGNPPASPDIIVSQDVVDREYREISSSSEEKVDLVIFGCPQCTIQEVQEISDLLAGQTLHPDTQLWICTSRWVKTLCERMGLTDRVEASGGRIVADVGAADAPHCYLREQGVRVIAVNSARASYYAHNLMGMETWFGSTQACVRAAVTGKWEGPR